MSDDITINGLFCNELNLDLYEIIAIVREKYRFSGKPVNGNIFVTIEDTEPYLCSIRAASVKRDAINQIIIQRCLLQNLHYKQNPNEFEYLIAHEFSHIYNNDYDKIKYLIGFQFIFPFIVLTISQSTLNNVGISCLVIVGSALVAGRLYMSWRRKMETRCDMDAFFVTKNSVAAINVFTIREHASKELDKIVGINRYKRYFWKCFYLIFGRSHPEYIERIKNIHTWEQYPN